MFLECEKEYKENYTFFVMLCKCGCGDYFRICEECSHMFYRCDCGCEGNYNKCSQYIGEFLFYLFSLNMLVFLVGWGCLTPYL